MQVIDLTGRRFGRWLVIAQAASNKDRAYWRCVCDCGTEVNVAATSLRRGKSLSCGCLRGEQMAERNRVLFVGVPPQRRQPLGMAMARYVFQQYASGARKRGRAWDIDFEMFLQLTAKDCTYCGAPPSRTRNRATAHGGFRYNGLDRIDSNGGYTVTNVVSCCATCNYMKASLSVTAFIAHCHRIAERQPSVPLAVVA